MVTKLPETKRYVMKTDDCYIHCSLSRLQMMSTVQVYLDKADILRPDSLQAGQKLGNES